MNKANILFVEPSIYTAQVGGSFHSLYCLLRYLDRDKYKPTVLFFREHNYLEKYEAAGAEVIVDDKYFRKSRIFALNSANPLSLPGRAIRKMLHLTGISGAERLLKRERYSTGVIRSLIRKKNISLLHANEGLNQDLASILAARGEGIPCVCHERRFDRIRSRTRRLSRHVDLSVAVSEGVKQSLLRQRVRCKKVVSIYNAVETGATVEGTRRLERHGPFRAGGAELIVGMFGNVQPWKGQDVLLRAVRRIRDAVSDVKVIFVGGVADADAPYFETLRAMVREHDLGGLVRFTGYRDDVYEIMCGCDIVVHASIRPEPFGRVIAEGLAAGAAVVAPRSGAPVELIEDGVNGLLFETGNHRDLADQIIGLCRDGDRRQRLGDEARSSAPAKFDPHARALDIQREYDQLLGWS